MVGRAKEAAKSSSKDETKARGKSPSRKSPSRKSPSRTTEKSKSPSRKPKGSPSPSKKVKSKSPSRKSPARKSPSRKSPTRVRTARSPARPKSAAETSEVAKIRKRLELDSDSEGPNYYTSTEKPKAAVRGRARKLDADYVAPKSSELSGLKDLNNYIGVVRRSSQRTNLSSDTDRLAPLQQDIAVKKLTEFSDEDDIPILNKRSTSLGKVAKTEAGGLIGTLLAIVGIPLFLVGTYFICNENNCSFTKVPNFERLKLLSTYLDPAALLTILGYFSLLAVLSLIPVGGRVTGLASKQGRLDYVTNGLFCAVTVLAVVGGLEYSKVPIVSIVITKHLQLLISSIIIGILLSIYFYVHSFYVPIINLNPNAVGSCKLWNFFIGREVNPRVFNKLDLKLLIFRAFIIGAAIVNTLFIYKNIEFVGPVEVGLSGVKGIKFNPTLVILATLQIIYLLDIVVFESTIVSSSTIQHDALGYFPALGFSSGPFTITLVTKCVFDHGIKLPTWQLILAVVIFCIGYILYRGSNNQKHAFRTNPYNPALSHLESIPTSAGKKLLVSGYWGRVRHPNYLGDIIMWLAFGLFVLKTPAVVSCLLVVANLINRAHDDGKQCKARYGTSWDRYCQRVKYVLVPKLY